jgi:phosphoenolpyruvate---glycerone phosphotransferase subunit DhaL
MASAPLERALLGAAGALEASADELNRLDGFSGDGDMGVTMTEVARAIREVLGAGQPNAGDPELLSACGAAIARSAPSTSGTLVATGFLRASKAVSAVPESEGGPAETLARAFAAAMEGIQSRGKASVGDRTLVDGLDAVCKSLQSCIEKGASWQEALRVAAKAAAAAAEASATMVPKVGRASWVPERALGHPDAGCAMLALTLAAVSASTAA